jgi:hypothetical protein
MRSSKVGYWGYGPWDSDQASDWFHDTLEPVVKPIRDAIKEAQDSKEFTAETYAAAWLLGEISLNYVYPGFPTECNELCNDMLLVMDRYAPAFAYGFTTNESALIGEYMQKIRIKLQNRMDFSKTQ